MHVMTALALRIGRVGVPSQQGSFSALDDLRTDVAKYLIRTSSVVYSHCHKDRATKVLVPQRSCLNR